MSHIYCSFCFVQEGMFNNANVIYRTKFVDGVSTVSRTIGSGAARSPGATSDKGPKKKRGKTGRKGKENTVNDS